ncbi:GTP-binding protein lepa [Dichomitus squalens LYAD-421 SS1]|uniref:GTP-binding protein lepa n=1 Tax=Dichomitus squalens (strain LYAD-421) TaxID=732165 RepID=UPI000441231E|nr:GTP-binding protein lepa [Dichomitus squalens LYAD-421 SS1]EJF66270.1 GTP-binding protein lepa [Dichomitus squalens LYAD-421 SS1]
MEDYPCEVIRNFSIIAHIDHGKSTLADRLLELTNTITKKDKGLNQQVLDKLKVERERGITVKAQTASMFHEKDGTNYLLNLIDTPGHVDFSWEVARSLAACQGALLLVDASQGVQAQSISVFHVAREKGLTIIPVLNKIDLPAAQPEIVALQMQSTFGLDPSDVIQISAKTGKGVEKVLQAIVNRIPPPVGDPSAPLKGFLFDSSYDRYRGVISLMSIQGGVLRKGDRIASCHTRKKYEVAELGIMYPEEVLTDCLRPGQVGFVACSMKESGEAHIGDTFHCVGQPVEPMPGFKPAKAMVYAGIYPVDSSDFLKLEESIKRLSLTDRSVEVTRETSSALGQGCRLGFLGTLHMDVFRQRLEDEYDANVIITAPTVPYQIVHRDGRTSLISNPTEFPDPSEFASGGRVKDVLEPIVKASIIVPEKYFSAMMDLCFEHRGTDLDWQSMEAPGQADGGEAMSNRVLMSVTLPLAEIVTGFFDKLKSRSSGFASFDYEDAGYQKSDLRKMTFLLNHKPVDALALIVHAKAVDETGRYWVEKLFKIIPRQLFEVPIQAAVGNTIIARRTLSALRADVTAGLYGGHYERKLKHLQNQKESKRKMKRVGRIDLPQEAFFDLLSSK